MSGDQRPMPSVMADHRADGSVVLRDRRQLPPEPRLVTEGLLAKAAKNPDRIALADRLGAPDQWRSLTYGQFADATAGVGQSLLDHGLGPGNPLMLVSDNRIEAAVALFAAYRAGVPVASVTPAYSRGAGDLTRLATVIETLRPGLLVVDRHAAHREALQATLKPGVSIIEMEGGDWPVMAAQGPGESFARAEGAVGPASIAKILFTSGSTGVPKGVINTQGMLASNLDAVCQAWPFLADSPPVAVDWLPWNHTFGGNFVLNTVLALGGSLFIDDGKPIPGLIERTVVNSAQISPTVHFNTPRGLEMVARILAKDGALADGFFRNLQLVFFASAGLPDRVRDEWQRLIDRHAGRPIPFCSSWGSTETAPMATALTFEAPEINNIGTPAVGTEIKLAPFSGRYEICVKGPNVTPGYLNRDDLTAAAFDEEGFFKSGDAGRLADPARPEAGLLIEGRLGEDFKLSTGVWVSVGGVRSDFLEVAGPMARDAVVSGPDQNEIVALIFLDPERCAAIADCGPECNDLAGDEKVQAHFDAAVARYNADNPGSSRRLARVHLMARPLGTVPGELTEKGTLNQRLARNHEADLCRRLHALALEPAGPQ